MILINLQFTNAEMAIGCTALVAAVVFAIVLSLPYLKRF